MSLLLTECLESVQQLYGNRKTALTPTDFLNELRAIRAAYNWFLTKDGRIRATFGAETGNRVFDPITAVAFARTGKFVREGAWSTAAAALGMSLGDCADFASACSFDWDSSCRQGALRKNVLIALQMELATQPEPQPVS
jgi:hypothetical protein